MAKQYEFVTVKVLGFLQDGTTEHRDIICDYGAIGYRYAGYIPLSQDSNGRQREIDLIFEKDVDEENGQ